MIKKLKRLFARPAPTPKRDLRAEEMLRREREQEARLRLIQTRVNNIMRQRG